MTIRRFVLCPALGFLLVATLLPFPAAAGAGANSTRERGPRVDPKVERAIEEHGRADFWIRFRDQADLTDASRIQDWDQRGRAVVDALQATAKRSQAAVAADLRRRNLEHTSFWAANVIHVRRGGRGALRAAAERPEVRNVRAPRTYALPDPVPATSAPATTGVEWGVVDIGADVVWSSYATRGEGIVVGNIDTGVEYDHPALVRQYLGSNGDGTFVHDYTWFDPSNACGNPPVPCDDHGHGTHTMGTMVGSDGATNHIGVAPGARWIAAKGCGSAGCPEFDLVASGQWMLAPTDQNGTRPNPGKRPHVVNNSWGTDAGGDTFYEEIVDSWVAAGIFPVFANGNNGYSGCGTVGAPASYAASYGVGAYDVDGAIGAFSSLGPSPIDGATKPDLSAPGVAVRSSLPGNEYDAFSGTSMAAPHLAGTIALMLSAAPPLVGDIVVTKDLLNASARDADDTRGCGGTLARNNTFGEGRLDAAAAVDGSPRGSAGTLTGRVTDAENGLPIGGAEVRVEGGPVPRTVATGNDGSYRLFLSAGDYTVAAGNYGYASVSTPVRVDAGVTTEADVALPPLPRSVVSGTVTDGSGHGWPLYARLDIAGYPLGPVFTDPVTGAYQVELVEGIAYDFNVSPLTGAYKETTRGVRLPADTTTQSFAIAADSSCTAPGYRFGFDGLSESFNDGTLPAGWRVVDNLGTGQVWRFDDPIWRGNRTGGDGAFAMVDSDFEGGQQDTELITPVIDLSAATAPVIRFKQDVVTWSYEDFAVDISADGGVTWSTVWHHTGGDGNLNGPLEIDVPQLAGEPDARVRWHYYNANYDYWWQVDDVLVGQPGCVAVPGAMVVGTTTDRRTGLPLDGVVVTSDAHPDERAASIRTPLDPNVPDGLYHLFSSADGPLSFTATRNLYGPTSATVDVVYDAVVRLDIAVGAGHLVAPPAAGARVQLGDTTETTVSLTNDGTHAADFDLRLSARGAEPLGALREPRRAALDADIGWIAPDRLPPPSPAEGVPGGTRGTAWESLPDYPVAILDNAAAAYGGKVYSVGGMNFDGIKNDLYIYNPDQRSWSHGNDMLHVRAQPAAAFIEGRLYVFGGWDELGLTRRSLEVYDPGTGTWTRLADAPVGRSASGVAVLDGHLYVIGGCVDDFCVRSNEVYRYDSGADAWARLADFPMYVAYPACGTVDGTVYCAGGATYVDDSRSFRYDPLSDSWHPIASLPIPLFAGAHAAANGQLVVSGGITYRASAASAGDGGPSRPASHFYEITDQGFAYDPFSDSWSPIPPSRKLTYRGGGACGFYRIGGAASASLEATVELLPGYDECVPNPPSWLSAEPASGTVAAGETTTLRFRVDAAGAGVAQPGLYTATVTVRETTPSAVPPIAVTVEVTPPPGWGKVTGTITGLARCDAPGAALPRATVVARGVSSTYEVATAPDGRYSVWFPETEGPVSLEVGADGFVAATIAGIGVDDHLPAVRDVALRRDGPCATAAPGRIDVTVPSGSTATADVVLGNRGAGSYAFTVSETPERLDAIGTRATFSEPAAVGPLSVRSRTARPAGGSTQPSQIPSWFGGADLEIGLSRFAATQCDGDRNHAYLFGGVDWNLAVSNRALRYNASTNTWTELAAVPAALEGPTAVCEAGRIHLLGGSGTNSHYVYDVSANSWSAAAPLPRNVWGAAAAAWNGRIFLAGGESDFRTGGTSDQVDVYSIATEQWEVMPARMPAAAFAAGSAQVGHYLYVVGGWDDGAPANNLSTVQRLDVISGTWTTGPSFAGRRADFALAATGAAIYAVGGDRSGGGFFDESELVDRLPLAGWPDASWTPFDPLPDRFSANGSSFCTEALFSGEVWSVGGVHRWGWASERTFLHGIGEEGCPTIRTDVPWLAPEPAAGSVAGDTSAAVRVTVDATHLQPGSYTATLIVNTTDPEVPELRVPVSVTVEVPPPVIYVSVAQPANVSGLAIDDEDIVGVNRDGLVTPFFDGSDMGLSATRIDAFSKLPDGSIVLSFADPFPVPGISEEVDDSDLVRFVPSSLGADTAGTFAMWFDGSDVELTTADEDVDAVEILDDGRIVLSTSGSTRVGKLTARGEDLLAFAPRTLGPSTAGTWAWYFDGSDVDLSTADELVDAVAIRGDGAIALSTAGSLIATGITAANEDVVAFAPTALGPKTQGTFSSAFILAGASLGLASNDVSGVDLA